VFVYYGVFSITITPNMPVRNCPVLLPSANRPSTLLLHQLLCAHRAEAAAVCPSVRATPVCMALKLADATAMQIAYMISGMIYFMWSLHCGFIIPSPSYPGWWIWL